MRTDLPSMNPGKAMAQASHASNKFIYELDKYRKDHRMPEEMEHLYGQAKLWQYQTDQGFGTVLVLGCDKKDIENLVQLGSSNICNYMCGVVIDPTYPYILDNEVAELIEPHRHTIDYQHLRDNNVVCFREEITCAYAFSEKSNPMLRLVIGHLDLHP